MEQVGLRRRPFPVAWAGSLRGNVKAHLTHLLWTSTQFEGASQPRPGQGSSDVTANDQKQEVPSRSHEVECLLLPLKSFEIAVSIPLTSFQSVEVQRNWKSRDLIGKSATRKGVRPDPIWST